MLAAAVKVGAIDGVDLGPARCDQPADPSARGAALASALGPNARRGRELWESLGPARERAERNRDVLAEVLR